jgi:hypothetical protein
MTEESILVGISGIYFDPVYQNIYLKFSNNTFVKVTKNPFDYEIINEEEMPPIQEEEGQQSVPVEELPPLPSAGVAMIQAKATIGGNE